MELGKDAILSFLRERGESKKADQAAEELPEQVDTERDARLLERFGSLAGVKSASVAELAAVPGFSVRQAERILDHLKAGGKAVGR